MADVARDGARRDARLQVELFTHCDGIAHIIQRLASTARRADDDEGDDEGEAPRAGRARRDDAAEGGEVGGADGADDSDGGDSSGDEDGGGRRRPLPAARALGLRLAAVHLIDAHQCRDAAGFIAGSVLALTTMVCIYDSIWRGEGGRARAARAARASRVVRERGVERRAEMHTDESCDPH